MKKCLLLLTLLVMLLTACGQRPAQTTQTKPETASAPQSAEQKPETLPTEKPLPTPPGPAPGAGMENATKPGTETLPDRSAATELTFLLEGAGEAVSATLYVGEGWSIYIPDEGWRLDDRDRDDGVFQTVWESTVNDDAELWVLSLGQRTLAEAQTWLQREEDDYVFQEDKQGGLYGTDREDRELMEVRFHEGNGALYAVDWTYPEEAAEGFGTRLSVMADTFEITS